MLRQISLYGLGNNMYSPQPSDLIKYLNDFFNKEEAKRSHYKPQFLIDYISYSKYPVTDIARHIDYLSSILLDMKWYPEHSEEIPLEIDRLIKSFPNQLISMDLLTYIKSIQVKNKMNKAFNLIQTHESGK